VLIIAWPLAALIDLEPLPPCRLVSERCSSR
jgi:hypothetical protein